MINVFLNIAQGCFRMVSTSNNVDPTVCLNPRFLLSLFSLLLLLLLFFFFFLFRVSNIHATFLNGRLAAHSDNIPTFCSIWDSSHCFRIRIENTSAFALAARAPCAAPCQTLLPNRPFPVDKPDCRGYYPHWAFSLPRLTGTVLSDVPPFCIRKPSQGSTDKKYVCCRYCRDLTVYKVDNYRSRSKTSASRLSYTCAIQVVASARRGKRERGRDARASLNAKDPKHTKRNAHVRTTWQLRRFGHFYASVGPPL